MQSAFSQEEPSSIQRMFARIAPRYDLANTLLSLGMDALWRRRVGREVAAWKPADVLDLATGSGALALEILRQNPDTCLIGADFCLPMLIIARQRGIKGLIAADGLALPFGEHQFDAVTVAFGLRNMASWETALREVGRVLRQNGHVLILDFSLPKQPLLPFYRFYLHRVLPKLAGWVTGSPEAYQYFGDSIEAFPKGETMIELMTCCGFSDCHATPLSCGIVTVYTGKK